MADIFGKEDALFVPTGTLSNLISCQLMTNERARGLVVGSKTHLVNYERGGMATVGHIFPLILDNEPDGTIALNKIEAALPKVVDPHVIPISGLSLESSHNVCNGRVLRPEYISAVRKLAKKKKLLMHLDGARVWNASVFLGVELKDYTKDFDLISCCLSKGMGCPAGSLIVGSHKDMVEARNLRKMLGAGMRQSGVLAACGMVSLNDWQEKLTADQANASWLAAELAEIKGVLIDPKIVETNIIRFAFEPRVLKNIKTDYFGIGDKLKAENILINVSFKNDGLRAVAHRDVSRQDFEKLVKAIRTIIN